jgi:hypothetical protein
MRDLTVTEDLAETGWARWESLKAQQSTPNGALKKKSK